MVRAVGDFSRNKRLAIPRASVFIPGDPRGNAESVSTRLRCLERLEFHASRYKRSEAPPVLTVSRNRGQILFSPTNLPFLYRIQVGWTTLVLGMSRNLFNRA